LAQPIDGKDVILVEDIIDTGYTLKAIYDMLKIRNPHSIEICVLLDKPSRRKVEVPVRYKGFEIPDLFVVGFGIDFAEQYRNLPYVGYIE
jgi:hypoxanthine phosphoribosyltransferase